MTWDGYVLFFPAAVVNLRKHSLHWKTWRTLKRFNRLPFLIVNFEWQWGQGGIGCVLLELGIRGGFYLECFYRLRSVQRSGDAPRPRILAGLASRFSGTAGLGNWQGSWLERGPDPAVSCFVFCLVARDPLRPICLHSARP